MRLTDGRLAVVALSRSSDVFRVMLPNAEGHSGSTSSAIMMRDPNCMGSRGVVALLAKIRAAGQMCYETTPQWATFSLPLHPLGIQRHAHLYGESDMSIHRSVCCQWSEGCGFADPLLAAGQKGNIKFPNTLP